MNTLNLKCIALILMLAGSLNWGLVGIADFNLVSFLFQSFPVMIKVIYCLVGLSAIYTIYIKTVEK